MTGLRMRISGQVTSAICRTSTKGFPVLELLLSDAQGQVVRAIHAYSDKSPASHYAAAALARNLRGKSADLDATNPRFKSRRLDCDVQHIYPQQTNTRKDLE